METLDSLREERDEARHIALDLLISVVVEAHDEYNLGKILTATASLARCPYPEAKGIVEVGLALGNFVCGCACISAFVKPSEQGEVLFDATRAA